MASNWNYDIAINIICGSIIPTILYLLYCYDIVAFTTFKLLLFIFFLIFVVFPIIFKYSYNLQRAVVFLNFINVPPHPEYDNPEKYGIEGVRNFYVDTDDGIKLGVWQILPQNLVGLSNDTSASYFENVLQDGRDVIIYNHGNSGSRVTPHRIELYKVLRQHFHVIAYDYRSYGDSSDVDPTEDNIVQDCIFMYKWVVNRTRGNLFIWGHSLGTSITIHALADMQPSGVMPAGVILESPFNNMREEISEFPLAKLFKNLPWFTYTVIEPMQENNFKFSTDKHICNVDVPIIILHAEEDQVVPYKLGRKLYEGAMKCRTKTQGSIQMHKFDKKYEYGHKYICRAPEIHDIIRNFVKEALLEDRTKNVDKESF